MMSDERIDEIAKPFAGWGGVEQYREFANAIEREATAPLLEQIGRLQGEIWFALAKSKEDEALMRDVLEAMTAEPEMREGACSVAIEALRERLEAKG